MPPSVHAAGRNRGNMGRTPPTLYWNTGRCCRMWCFTALTSVVRTCISTPNPNAGSTWRGTHAEQTLLPGFACMSTKLKKCYEH